MKKGSSFLSLILSALILFSSLPLPAQTLSWQGWPAQGRAEQSRTDAFVKYMQQQVLQRRADVTLETLLTEYTETFAVDGLRLAAVLNDEKYVQTLSEEEASALIGLIAFARFSGIADARKMVEAAASKLRVPYDENAQEYPVKMFYVLALAEMGHHSWMWRDVQNWAFAQIKAMTNRASAADKVWAAYVLMYLAYPGENEENIFSSPYDDAQTVQYKKALAANVWIMDADARWQFEQKIENLIARFSWLQYEQADYFVTGVKNKVGLANQTALISLFAQASSWFAMQDDDGFIKQMVSTGGLNALGRAAMTNEKNAPGRFLDDRENFYLHHPVPGTDGKGHFANTPNGQRHLALSLLVQGLMVSYVTQGTDTGNQLAMAFIRRHMRTDSEGHFVSYLFIALQAIRLCNILFDSASLNGWEKEMGVLQQEMADKLQKGYAWNRVCAGVQGACEVATEWIALGEVIGWVFRGIGKGAGFAGRQVVKALPDRAVFGLAVAQIAVKQGGKTVARWGKTMIHGILGKCGWKAAGTAAGAAVLLRADTRSGAAQ